MNILILSCMAALRNVLYFPSMESDNPYVPENLIMIDSKTGIARLRERLEEGMSEFCFSSRFTQVLLHRYCYHGFLPMAVNISGIPLLALKLHQARVLLKPGDVQIPKSTLKKFASCQLTVDCAFDQCVRSINETHADSWLSPELVNLFAKTRARKKKGKVRLHSVELWRDATLIAGEIGYTVGSSYTSLTGFRTENSSGKAQLYALGKLLAASGFHLWDLGMYTPYKIDIGGRLYSRDAFLHIQSMVRDRCARFSKLTPLLGDM